MTNADKLGLAAHGPLLDLLGRLEKMHTRRVHGLLILVPLSQELTPEFLVAVDSFGGDRACIRGIAEHLQLLAEDEAVERVNANECH